MRTKREFTLLSVLSRFLSYHIPNMSMLDRNMLFSIWWD